MKKTDIDSIGRYKGLSKIKSEGVTYTPAALADFVANRLLNNYKQVNANKVVRILDPAVGDGQLLDSILNLIPSDDQIKLEVVGYDIDSEAVAVCQARLMAKYPNVSIDIRNEDFIDRMLEQFNDSEEQTHIWENADHKYNFVISNPPYVRTQIMGFDKTKRLSEFFKLNGRIDLYYAFIIGISNVLSDDGYAGIIVSNKFMATKAGRSLRELIRSKYNIQHIWDLGDTKLFDVAVLPAVLLLGGKGTAKCSEPPYTSVYEVPISDHVVHYKGVFQHIAEDCIVNNGNGHHYRIKQGYLKNDDTPHSGWLLSTTANNRNLDKVKDFTWKCFEDIGKIRVGIKTCADKIMIRTDWENMSDKPELLRPLTTHHIASRYKALTEDSLHQVIYPYTTQNGKRHLVPLDKYPFTSYYLQTHRKALEDRSYLMQSGREWYEIWVPHNPSLWMKPKLVFRDIAEKPTFWMDLKNTIINGDCYWLVSEDNEEDILWLACAVANSTFTEWFYDSLTNNKLYAGRRRFMTQYVNKFPLPDPKLDLSQIIIKSVKHVYDWKHNIDTISEEQVIDKLVWESFGLKREEVLR